MTKQDFVATVLSRDTLILDLTNEAVSARTVAACEVYDIMVKELMRHGRFCESCKFADASLKDEPCHSCFATAAKSGWTLK